jgi:hypothetical protein
MDGIETTWPTEDQIPPEYKPFKESGQLTERDDGTWGLKVAKVDKFRGSLREKTQEIGKLQDQLTSSRKPRREASVPKRRKS